MKRYLLLILSIGALTLTSCGEPYETRPSGSHDTEEMVIYTPAETSNNQRKQADPEEDNLELNEDNDNSAETTVPMSTSTEETEVTTTEIDLSGLFDDVEETTESEIDLSGLFD